MGHVRLITSRSWQVSSYSPVSPVSLPGRTEAGDGSGTGSGTGSGDAAPGRNATPVELHTILPQLELGEPSQISYGNRTFEEPIRMLMSRRVPATWTETIRLALWPRRSWSRSIRYVQLRARRLKVVPRSLALGVAVGMFVAILPIPGLQVLSAAGLAWLVRGHSGAAALATFAANPITYPLIWIASYVVGATLLGTPVSEATHDLDTLSDLMAQPWSPTALPSGGSTWGAVMPVLLTLALGAMPLAVLSAIAAYYLVARLLAGDEPATRSQSRVNPVVLSARRGISRQLATRSPRAVPVPQRRGSYRAAA